MTAPVPHTTSSSTAPIVPPSSSVSPFAAGIYALPHVLPPAQGGTAEPFWKSTEFVVSVIGMLITGIIGYFSAQQALKESIATIQGQVNVLTERVSAIKPAADAVPGLQKDLAVLDAKLQTMQRDSSTKK